MAEFVKLRVVAAELSICPKTVRRMVEDGEFPKPVVMGGNDRWLRSEVDQWKAERIAERENGGAE